MITMSAAYLSVHIFHSVLPDLYAQKLPLFCHLLLFLFQKKKHTERFLNGAVRGSLIRKTTLATLWRHFKVRKKLKYPMKRALIHC